MLKLVVSNNQNSGWFSYSSFYPLIFLQRVRNRLKGAGKWLSTSQRLYFISVSTWLINIQMVPMKLSWGTIIEFDTLLNWFSGINQILMFSFCVYSVTYCDNKLLFMTFTRKNTGTQSQYLKCCFYQWVLLFSGVLDLRLKLMKNILK